MPRRVTDEAQRKQPVSFTLRQIVKAMVEAEANRHGLLFGPMMETLALEALASRGYPVEDAEPPDTASELRDSFLSHYELTGNVTEAARATGVALNTVYQWNADDADFRARFTKAKLSKSGVRGSAQVAPGIGRQRGRRPITEVPGREPNL